MQQEAQQTGEHPWAARKRNKGRSTDFTEDELDRLRSESKEAKQSGTPWQQRGLAQIGSSSSSSSSRGVDVPYWRGQPWRCGCQGCRQRCAKRGGTNKEYYKQLNMAGLLRPTPTGAVRVTKPDDKPRWDSRYQRTMFASVAPWPRCVRLFFKLGTSGTHLQVGYEWKTKTGGWPLTSKMECMSVGGRLRLCWCCRTRYRTTGCSCKL